MNWKGYDEFVTSREILEYTQSEEHKDNYEILAKLSCLCSVLLSTQMDGAEYKKHCLLLESFADKYEKRLINLPPHTTTVGKWQAIFLFIDSVVMREPKLYVSFMNIIEAIHGKRNIMHTRDIVQLEVSTAQIAVKNNEYSFVLGDDWTTEEILAYRKSVDFRGDNYELKYLLTQIERYKSLEEITTPDSIEIYFKIPVYASGNQELWKKIHIALKDVDCKILSTYENSMLGKMKKWTHKNMVFQSSGYEYRDNYM